MSESVSIGEFGNRNVKENLAVLPEKMLDWAFEALMQQAGLIRDLAQIYVRVETGSLRDSIRIERGGEGKAWRRVTIRAGGYIVNPKTNKLVNYAVFVEAKFPFMAPAFAEVAPTLGDMIARKVVESV